MDPAIPSQTTIHKAERIAFAILLASTTITIIALGTTVGAGIGATLMLGAGISGAFASGAFAGTTVGLMAGAKGADFIAKRHLKPRLSTHTLNLNDPKAPPLGQSIPHQSVLVTRDSQESVEWKTTLIRHAEQSIELSGNFCGGKVFRDLLDVIGQRLGEREPLKVHLLTNDDLLEKADLAKLAALKAQFPQRFHFLISQAKIKCSPVPMSVDNHVKLLIVDGKYFITGGSGLQKSLCGAGDKIPEDDPTLPIQSRLLAGGVRDMDVVVTGTLAATLRVEYFKLLAIWEREMGVDEQLVQRYFSLKDAGAMASIAELDGHARLVRDSSIQAVVSCIENPRNACTEQIVETIQRAQRKIRLAQLCFNPVKKIREALQVAVQRGVEIELIVTGGGKRGTFLGNMITQASRSNYLSLMVGHKITSLHTKQALQGQVLPHVKIYEYAVPNIMYHKKVLTIDDRYTWIGSYNLSIKSHFADYELMLKIDSPAVVKAVESVLDHDRDAVTPPAFPIAFEHAYPWVSRFSAWFQKRVTATFAG